MIFSLQWILMKHLIGDDTYILFLIKYLDLGIGLQTPFKEEERLVLIVILETPQARDAHANA